MARIMAPVPAARDNVLDVDAKKVKTDVDTICINQVRCLAAALPHAAKSGHPGAPMGCAPIAHALWAYLMKYAPKDPLWINRDRFVLSNGHASALQYTMLHLTGYDISLNDLRQFRQLHSKCPGHPEANHGCPGIEVTTGPLGQGVAQAVGLAIASDMLASQYKDEAPADLHLFQNYTYCISGDGCMQEGVSSEACSLAGHLKTKRLILMYDDNEITIDGSTTLAFTENTEKRFEAYGWHVLSVKDGDNDFKELLSKLEQAKKLSETGPVMVAIRTTIGFGSNKAGHQSVHGTPLPYEEMQRVRDALLGEAEGKQDDLFHMLAVAETFYHTLGDKRNEMYDEWTEKFQAACAKNPKLAALTDRYIDPSQALLGQLPSKFNERLQAIQQKFMDLAATVGNDATRNTSNKFLNIVAAEFPELVGGSADLTDSNKTGLNQTLPFAGDLQASSPQNRYIRFGVREFAMASICNGLYAYGRVLPFCGTFLNFVSYSWPAVKLAALSKYGVLHIATHDSIEQGEDGPTHQPVELLSMIRSTPNCHAFRPADGNEVGAGYLSFLQNRATPTVMCLCRASTPKIEGTCMMKALKGGYVVRDFLKSDGKKIILAASGTELNFVMGAATMIEEQVPSVSVRVVSMPCYDIFSQQTADYQESVLLRQDPQVLTRSFTEASHIFGLVGMGFDSHTSVGMTTFGHSAPGPILQKYMGFSAENVASKVIAGIE